MFQETDANKAKGSVDDGSYIKFQDGSAHLRPYS